MKSKTKNVPWQGGAEGFATENPKGKVAPVSQPVRDGTLAAKLYADRPLVRNDGNVEAGTVNSREAEALSDAIPADVMERALAKTTKQTPSVPTEGVVLPPKPKRKRSIVRGDVLLHKPTGRQVTVVKPEVGVTGRGVIKHKVMTRGFARKFEVPETSLEELP